MQATIVRVIFFTLLLLEFPSRCVANDTMRFDEKLADDGGTLVSAGQRFVLGFFGSRGRYLGIWYYGNTTSDLQRTVVWVANRDNPIPGQKGVLQIASDGNLTLLDGQSSTSYFSTTGPESSKSMNRILKLLDSGNLAFIDTDSGRYLWQSFENPTDTFLPGMRMDDKMKLTSWISHDDPGTGNYTFQQDQKDATKYSIVKRTDPQWNRDLQSGMFLPSIELHKCVVALLSNFSRSPVALSSNFSRSTDPPRSKIHANKTTAQFFKRLQNFSSASNYSQELSLFSTTRLFMNSSGEIQFYGSVDWHAWFLLWLKTYDPCSVYNPCGNFGICNNEMGQKTCHCLAGFEPKSIDNWKSGEFSSGCARKTPCSKNTNDTFLNFKLTKAAINSPTHALSSNATECKEECLSNCECQAYSYSELSAMRGRNDTVPNCYLWMTDLYNIHMDDQSTDSISIRAAVSDIKSTRRDCETCGKYIVPYPLSSRFNCGEPSYRSFFCDNSRGQLQFRTLSSTYDVVNIYNDEKRFVIHASVENDVINCGAKDWSAILLNKSSPFQVINCNDSSEAEYYRIEISWKPPSEPLCNSSLDCLDWPNSSCEAFAKGLRMCLCLPTYRWDGVTLKCTPEVLASSKRKRKPIISIIVIVAFTLASSFSYIFFRRTILAKRQGSSDNILGNPMPYLDDVEMRTQDLVIEDNRAIDVPFFCFESIQTATDNFSEANKLGRGGFGPVYKGVFPGGKEIAVKRLSSHSGQGIQEFQNEVKLIAKLQHRNLVKLLGYCIWGSEKLLLYEYMINKSLDTFIFDKGRCMLLDWGKRFEIILGITRGLLYLHQDSRLRIIHRDLKTSNILLDEELNPKISDFGLARIVGGKETEANTQTVVGTYGYMSPEYALEGLFSIKSDVFSFGVILLEIISGKRNVGFYEEVLSLLGYAWKLWQERTPMEFIDRHLLESCKSSASEVLKCINIGLLCVQEDPIDRPTMANVLMMLGSETATLPSPNQPAFISRKRPDSSISGSSSGKRDSNSINKMTVTAVEGR